MAKEVKPTTNEEAFHRFQLAINDVMVGRAELMMKMMDPRRDLNVECGYPDVLTVNHFSGMYSREPIANRVVKILPTATWQAHPKVFEKENNNTKTPFELALDDVSKTLRGTSWLKGEVANPLWEYSRRIDIMSGIGHYGILLLGLDDQKKLEEPADGIRKDGSAKGSNKATRKLLYLQAFDEFAAPVIKWEQDPTSPRFGQPLLYNVNFNVPGAPGGKNFNVHWSRVIHVADNIESNEVQGVPRQQPVYNRLHDLLKLYGGCAEMYWKGAFPGLSIETQPQLGGEGGIEIDKEGLRVQMFNYMNGLQRYLALLGLSAKSLAPQVSDPSSQINVLLDAVCVQLDVPKRKFMGSERGELASSEDDGDWNDLIRGRQVNHAKPRIIGRTIDRLIGLEVLPAPAEYDAKFPELDSLSEEDKASIALKQSQAMSAFQTGGCESMMELVDYYIEILKMDPDRAKAIVDNAANALDDPQSLALIQEKHTQENPPPPPMMKGLPAPAAKPKTAAKKKSATKKPKA